MICTLYTAAQHKSSSTNSALTPRLAMLLLLPEASMAFVMTHSRAFGAHGGQAAAAGIGFADLVMTALAA
jgi:threonine/homoserine/homoserine lactone efflux protein